VAQALEVAHDVSVAGALVESPGSPSTGRVLWGDVADPALDTGTDVCRAVGLACAGIREAGGAPGACQTAAEGPVFFALCSQACAQVGDEDGDGVESCDDNCPQAPNGAAEAGVPGRGNQTDTDADGQGDACDADDDADGLDDAVETDTGIYVSPSDTGTDPRRFDSDGDGIGDGDEVAAGSDPNQASGPASVPGASPALLFLALGGAGCWTLRAALRPSRDRR
jgi:hypothetical protein